MSNNSLLVMDAFADAGETEQPRWNRCFSLTARQAISFSLSTTSAEIPSTCT